MFHALLRAGLLGAALLVAGCGDVEEPHSGGRPLSHWVDEARQVSVFPWLNSRGDERRRAAFDHLVQIGEPAVPALVELLDDRRVGTRSDATNALGRLGPRAAAATPALIRRLGRRDEAAAAAILLGRIGPAAAAAAPALEALAAQPESRAGEAAAQALASLGEPGHRALERLGASAAVAGRRGSLAGRVSLARQEERSGALLASLLADPDPRVRRDALERMRPGQWGQTGAEEARAGLEPALEASHADDPALRQAADNWLVAAAQRLDEEGLGRVLTRAGSVQARRQAVWLLTPKFRRDAPPLGPTPSIALEQALRDPDPQVRIYSVLALSPAAPSSERLSAVARRALAELALPERARAAWIVYEVTRDPDDVVPTYRALLRDPELAHYAMELRGLRSAQPITSALRPELEALREHPSHGIQAEVRSLLDGLE